MKQTRQVLINAILGNSMISLRDLIDRLETLGELHKSAAYVDASAISEVRDHLRSQNFLALAASLDPGVLFFKLLGSGDDVEVIIYGIGEETYLGVKRVEFFSTTSAIDPSHFLIKLMNPEVKDALSLTYASHVSEDWVHDIIKDWKFDIDSSMQLTGLFSVYGYRDKLRIALASVGIEVTNFDDGYVDFSRPQDNVVAGLQITKRIDKKPPTRDGENALVRSHLNFASWSRPLAAAWLQKP